MNEKIIAHGIILSSSPVGEADRRLVVLTGELGKITAFARNARKPGSALVGATRPFSYGEMILFQGRTSYSLDSFSDGRFFDGLSSDLEGSCYASYFTELADYYTHEGLEARETVRLLYAAFLMLEKSSLERSFIKSIFELKLMCINGEYSETPLGETDDAVMCAWKYVCQSSMEKLFKFSLDKKFIPEFSHQVDKLKNHFIERKFKSLDILESLL